MHSKGDRPGNRGNWWNLPCACEIHAPICSSWGIDGAVDEGERGRAAHPRKIFAMQRKIGRLAGQGITALKRARGEYKRVTTPQPDLPGVRRPFLIDPDLWERLEKDDVKYALKLAWKEYKLSLEPIFNRAEFNRKVEEAQRAAEEAEWRKEEEEAARSGGTTGASSVGPDGQPTFGARVGSAAREAASKLSSEELRQSAVKAAAQMASAIKDPAARAKVAEMATKGVIAAHGVVDSFLIGYYEGQAAELEKEKKEQEEAAKTAEDKANGGHSSTSSSSSANKTAFDVLAEVLQERHAAAASSSSSPAPSPSVAASSSSSSPVSDDGKGNTSATTGTEKPQ